MDAVFPMPAVRGGSARSLNIAYWLVTGLFCLEMAFTAYSQLAVPAVAQALTRLGFPGYFRVELAWAKFIGIALLILPVSSRWKEWAYAGFAICLISALIAHLAIGEGFTAWVWAAGTGGLWLVSYFLWLRSAH